MAPLLSRLEADIEARRARRGDAFHAVQGLRLLSANALGERIVEWLRVAYGWQPQGSLIPRPDWILERVGQRLLLRVMAGDRYATWHDLAELATATADTPYELIVLAAPSGVPDPDEFTGTPWEGVDAWGPKELEAIYMEIKHEVGGVSFWA